MKNKNLFFITLLFLASNFIFAKTIRTPGPKDVTLVGRIFFETDMDKEWYFDAFNIPEDKRSHPDSYIFPFIPGQDSLLAPGYSILMDQFERQAWGVNGDYFFVQYDLLSDRMLYLTEITLFLGGAFQLPVKLPLGFKIRIPEKEKFVYIGDFYFSAKGFGFEISGKRKEAFEAAQAALDKVTQKQYKLCYGNIEKITTDDLEDMRKHLSFSYAASGIDLNEWYKKMDASIKGEFNEQK